MNLSSPSAEKDEIQALVAAVAQNDRTDGVNFGLTTAQWKILSSYLQQFTAETGQVIIESEQLNRSVYLLERGSLSVHAEDAKGRIRLAMLGAGAVVGEASFFSHLPGTATVQVASPSVLWRLNSTRFAELANRQPTIALQLVMGLAGVLAKRLRQRSRRVAAT